ncbi:MAG: ATP-binding protein [Motiliproteus sp.]
MTNNKSSDHILLCVCVALSMVIFGIDLMLPLGVAGGVPYVLVVMLALRTSVNSYGLLFAVLSSILTLVGLYFSESGGIYWMVLANRGLALFAIWVTFFLGIELKRTQARLFESEDRFKVVADQAPVIIWGADKSGDWDFISKGWLEFTGRDLHQEQGSGWQEVIHPDDWEAVDRVYRAANLKRLAFQLECRVRRFGGEYRWLIIQGIPRFVEQHNFLGLIGTAVDVNQRKLTEQELEDTMQRYYSREKMVSIGTLAAGILHEIGNPVAGISGLTLELLKDVEESPSLTSAEREKLEQSLRIVHEETNRLIRITRDVSAFSSLHSEKLEWQDINNLVERTCQLMGHDQRMLFINLQQDLDRSIPAVCLVADYFVQVLFNLVGNAIDAFAGKEVASEIRIKTWKAGSRVMLEIRDNGCGMSAATLARAEEPYFTTKSDGSGLGLGLSLCRTLIEEQNGQLEIVSKEGEGTRVLISYQAEADIS